MFINHKTIRRLILVAVVAAAFYILIVPIAATSGQFSLNILAMGPGNRLIDLGFDGAVGLTQANVYYNIITFAFVCGVAGVADVFSTSLFCAVAAIFSGLFAYIGWFTTPNPAGPWGVIILAVILSVIMLMAEQSQTPSAGGDKLISIVMFMLVVQATIGLINGVGIFGSQTIGVATPSTCYSQGNLTGCSVNGTIQLANAAQNTGSQNIVTNSGNIFNYITTLPTMAWTIFGIVVQVLVSITFFGPAMVSTFPDILNNPTGLAVMAVIQLVIWIIYAFALARYVFKPMPGDMKPS